MNAVLTTSEQQNWLAHSKNELLPKYKASKKSEKCMRFVIEFADPDQIETLCKRFNLTIVAMKRIRIGRVSMKKSPRVSGAIYPERLCFENIRLLFIN
ncbi:MAG: hypothetical protein DIZ80_00295 [endosymbiont of Galathealinum brachiosum]|uniref:Uncharacterized protein n=1 Tax=endosymbiont of Galathealinum brachiosum TaxID=2200906 RepID=A0A370DM18_9GAMM|nr:MAG: hypothetical protein DIZ80_00295 [endosymbiont of Galathealinum brachiosum]